MFKRTGLTRELFKGRMVCVFHVLNLNKKFDTVAIQRQENYIGGFGERKPMCRCLSVCVSVCV